MSSHFNYEVDERELKARLKGMALPLSEEAWLRFEEFSEANCSGKTRKLPVIRLNLSRTLILPFVFGGVIILFSLLLVNFINIKPAQNAKAKNPEQSNSLATIEPNSNPEKKSVTPILTEPATNNNSLKTDTLTPKTISVTPVQTVAVTPTVTTAPLPTVITPTVTNQPASTIANAWFSNMSGQIYESPNIASRVIGSSQSHQTYQALEETNYFIKVSFSKGGEQLTGFIMKSTLSKGTSSGINNAANYARKKKEQKSETLEPKQTPMILGASSSENEPELK